MAINANMIVDVTPRAVSGGSSDLDFNGFVFTKNPLATAVDIFTTASGVGAQFGYESPEYAFAQTYWQADDNKTKSPKALCFGRLLDEATSAWLRGFTVTAELKDFQAITNGTLSVTVNGAKVDATSIDLSAAKSFSDVATAVAEKIGDVKGEFNSNMNAFIFTTTQTGASATMGYAEEGDLAQMLGLTEAQGAALWQGTDAQSFSTTINQVLNITQNWVTFTTIDEPSVDLAKEMAKWVSTNFGYIYFPYTTQTAAESRSSTTDLATVLKDEGVAHTNPIYGPYAYAANFMGMVAATDYNATNGVKTYAFKGASGLAPYVTNTEVAQILKEKKYSFYGSFATRNAQFNLSYEGALLGSSYSYLDELAGMIWFTNTIQRTIVDGMKTVNRVPYTEDGYTMVRMWLTDPINKALTNGYIQAGVEMSAAQKTQLIQEVGKDVSNDIKNNGYYLRVTDPGADVRAQRGSPRVQIYFTYGGAVHKMDVSVTAYF